MRARIARVCVFVFALCAGCEARRAPLATPGRDLDATPCTTHVSKGPWSLATFERGATVRWESCLPTAGALRVSREVGGDGGDDLRATSTVTPARVSYDVDTQRGIDRAGTFFMNEVRLDGLAPSTCYRFRVEGEAGVGRFCTARAPGEALTFAAIGDTSPARGHTEALAAQLLARGTPDFTLHAGDMQYYADATESWSFWFAAMTPWLLGGPLLPARGNHEREEPNELEEYYRRFFHDAGDGPGLGDAWQTSTAGVSFFGLDTESDFGPGSPQAAWLVRELDRAAARPGYRFSVIVMHRPFVTCGDSDAHEDARAALAGAFRRYRVALVLQGHQHGYERFEIDGTTYVTTGGGGAALEDNDANLDRPCCRARVASGSFYEAELVRIAGGPDRALEAVAIDDAGGEHDRFRKLVP
jgi:predicted phosphodiesterase